MTKEIKQKKWSVIKDMISKCKKVSKPYQFNIGNIIETKENNKIKPTHSTQ